MENSVGDREERTDKDQREGGRKGGGDTGELVVKYSGRGVDAMGGRAKQIRREQAKEFLRN